MALYIESTDSPSRRMLRESRKENRHIATAKLKRRPRINGKRKAVTGQ